MSAVLLTGCATAPDPGPVPDRIPTAAELAAQKQSAGIADCPASDPDVAPVAGGLPDLTLDCLGGGRTVRLAGLRGKPMMINVWGQWCGPCREEAPFVAAVAQDPPKGLVILGVDYDDPKPDWALEFAQLSGWRYPQLQDSDKRLAGPLRLSAGIPQTLFVRADGTIAYQHRAYFRSAAEIRGLLKEHLGVSS